MGNLCVNAKNVEEKKVSESARESDKTPQQKKYPYNWPVGAEQVGYLTERQVKARLKTQTEQVRFFVLPSVCPSVRVSPSLRCVMLDPRPRPRAFAANVVERLLKMEPQSRSQNGAGDSMSFRKNRRSGRLLAWPSSNE